MRARNMEVVSVAACRDCSDSQKKPIFGLSLSTTSAAIIVTNSSVITTTSTSKRRSALRSRR